MKNKLPKLFGRLGRFAWTAHNLIAHPASEVLFQLGFEKAATFIHEVTTPDFDLYIVSFQGMAGKRWLVDIRADGGATAVTYEEMATPLTAHQVRMAQEQQYPALTVKPYEPN